MRPSWAERTGTWWLCLCNHCFRLEQCSHSVFVPLERAHQLGRVLVGHRGRLPVPLVVLGQHRVVQLLGEDLRQKKERLTSYQISVPFPLLLPSLVWAIFAIFKGRKQGKYRAALKEPSQVVYNWVDKLCFVLQAAECIFFPPYSHNLGRSF